MSFLSSMLGQKVKDLHNTITSTIVSIDPKGATEAQIAEYVKNVDTLAGIAATAKAQVQADQNKVDALAKDKERHVTAATLYSAKPDMNETTLNTLLSDAERIASELTAAQSALAASKEYADQCVETHAQAVTKLTEARQHLQEAMRAQQLAEVEAQRSEQRKHDAEVAAGIISGSGSSLDTALNAMTAHTAELKKKTEANNMTIGQLSTDPSADVKAALAAVDVKPVKSAAERLAALKG